MCFILEFVSYSFLVKRMFRDFTVYLKYMFHFQKTVNISAIFPNKTMKTYKIWTVSDIFIKIIGLQIFFPDYCSYKKKLSLITNRSRTPAQHHNSPCDRILH